MMASKIEDIPEPHVETESSPCERFRWGIAFEPDYQCKYWFERRRDAVSWATKVWAVYALLEWCPSDWLEYE